MEALPKVCYEYPSAQAAAEAFPSLISSLNTYAKKHGQLKEAVVKMVDAAMTVLEDLQSGKGKVSRDYKAEEGQGDRWLDLVDCLRDITEGKVSGVVMMHTRESAWITDRILFGRFISNCNVQG